jgi:mannan endo-1,4-beta-mannosidase
VKVLTIVSQLAKEKNKVAALTETGLEGVTNPAWFTEAVLNPIKKNPEIQMSYLLVWRNATEKHHYAPYPGHASVADFMKFYDDPYTFFESDIRNIYQSGKPLLK